MLLFLRFNSVSHKLKTMLLKKPLLNFSQPCSKDTEASKLINGLISLRGSGCKHYLEIGVEFGRTLNAVNALRVYGVDPSPLFTAVGGNERLVLVKSPSNSFFSNLPRNEVFDFIFLDGLHTYEQTLRDFANSLEHVSWDSAIVIDDVLPIDEYSASPKMWQSIRNRKRLGLESMAWHGDVYKVIFDILEKMPHLHVKIIRDQDFLNGRAVVWGFKRSDKAQLLSDATHGAKNFGDYLDLLNEKSMICDWKTFQQFFRQGR
jgi:predicted O-methyltransferase YrrM